MRSYIAGNQHATFGNSLDLTASHVSGLGKEQVLEHRQGCIHQAVAMGQQGIVGLILFL